MAGPASKTTDSHFFSKTVTIMPGEMSANSRDLSSILGFAKQNQAGTVNYFGIMFSGSPPN
jgi:hypothetical protein